MNNLAMRRAVASAREEIGKLAPHGETPIDLRTRSFGFVETQAHRGEQVLGTARCGGDPHLHRAEAGHDYIGIGSSASELSDFANTLFSALGIVLAVLIVYVVVQRWLEADTAERRALRRLLVCGPPAMVVAAATLSLGGYARTARP